MRRLIYLFFALIFTLSVHAQTNDNQNYKVIYQKSDSTLIVRLLNEAQKLSTSDNIVLFLSRKLLGIPYVKKTLENPTCEHLIINLRGLDCTTFVENVLAMTYCAKNKLCRFEDFCRFLRLIRYRNGALAYENRLHYFSAWIEDNVRMGYVTEKQEPNPPFTATQTVSVDYMTTHANEYPMLVSYPELVEKIAQMEKDLKGLTRQFIPKSQVTNSTLLRSVVKDGDIIAIVTNKKGLDIAHLGIAAWHADGLHMIDASSIHHKVLEEKITLRTYLYKRPSFLGIRILSVR